MDDLYAVGPDAAYYMDINRQIASETISEALSNNQSSTPYIVTDYEGNSGPSIDWRQAYADNGFAGMEQAKQSLDKLNMSYSDLLRNNQSYNELLRQQTQEMSKQNELISSRHHDEARQSLDKADKVATPKSMSEAAKAIGEPVKDGDDSTIAKDVHDIAANVAKSAEAQSNTGNAKALQKAVEQGRREAVKEQEQNRRQGRPQQAESQFDWNANIRKLGMQRVSRAMSEFQGVADRWKAFGEAMSNFGDEFQRMSIPSKLAARASMHGVTRQQLDESAAKSANEQRPSLPKLPKVSRPVDNTDDGALGRAAGNTVDKVRSMSKTASEQANESTESTKAIATTVAKAIESKAPMTSTVAESEASKVAGKALQSGTATVAETAAENAGGSGILGGIGNLLSKGGGLVGAASKVLGPIGMAYGIWKGARDLHFNAMQEGAIQGGDQLDGYKEMASGAWQDVQNFLGLSNTSGKELGNYKRAASSAGFDLESEAGSNALEAQKWAKDHGMDSSTALAFSNSMLRAGASADEVRDSLQELKDAAKDAGTDLNTLAKNATSYKDTLVQAGVSAKDATSMATDYAEGMQKSLEANGLDNSAQGQSMFNSSNLAQAMRVQTILANGGDVYDLMGKGNQMKFLASHGLEDEAMSNTMQFMGSLANTGASNDEDRSKMFSALMEQSGLRMANPEKAYDAAGVAMEQSNMEAYNNLRKAEHASKEGNGEQKVNVLVHVEPAPGFASALKYDVAQDNYVNGSGNPLLMNNYQPTIGQN